MLTYLRSLISKEPLQELLGAPVRSFHQWVIPKVRIRVFSPITANKELLSFMVTTGAYSPLLSSIRVSLDSGKKLQPDRKMHADIRRVFTTLLLLQEASGLRDDML